MLQIHFGLYLRSSSSGVDLFLPLAPSHIISSPGPGLPAV